MLKTHKVLHLFDKNVNNCITKTNILWCSTVHKQQNVVNELSRDEVTIWNKAYPRDDYTNVTEKILSHVGKNLFLKESHPLYLTRKKLDNFFTTITSSYRFSIHDRLSPVVGVEQNFDSLLVPKDHVSRSKSDCYYVNREYLLRSHMTAHQSELIRSGFNNFLIVGDVYRRDEIDSSHYPVFHQYDAVRLRNRDEIFPNDKHLQLFEEGNNTCGTGAEKKQACHSLEAFKIMEHELKSTLYQMAKYVFGKDVQCRFVDAYFPFTEPSWELEVLYEGKWMELLGCGIMRQEILNNCGVDDRIGWAFGVGIERVGMLRYKIPDIRLFWSNDSGFLKQFEHHHPDDTVIYKPVSQYPQCKNDISFWLPEEKPFSSNDFYDLVRSVGGDVIEQVEQLEQFVHPKTRKESHCYRIVYRHMERTLTQAEVNVIHKNIEKSATEQLGVTIR